MRRVIDVEGEIINPDLEPEVSKDTLLKVYETMVTVRLLDEKGMKLQRQGRVGFHIPVKGQEAATGAAAALHSDDWILPAYREHGLAIYRGLPVEDIVHHLFANKKDYMTKGRRLPGLFGDPKYKFVNPSAPIGTQIIHATGLAAGLKYKAIKKRNDQKIAIVFFGDGATSSNDFHSGLNFAGVTKSPVIFYCNNNQYAISLPREKQTAAESIADKAVAYGIKGEQIDGMDVLAVIGAVQEASRRARKKFQPTLIEGVTYRLGAHTSSDDPSRYRDKEEVAKWEKKDPITRFEKYLFKNDFLTQKKVKIMKERITQDLNRYIKKAEEVSVPELETMFTDVYQEMPWHLREQLQELKQLKTEEE